MNMLYIKEWEGSSGVRIRCNFVSTGMFNDRELFFEKVALNIAADLPLCKKNLHDHDTRS